MPPPEKGSSQDDALVHGITHRYWLNLMQQLAAIVAATLLGVLISTFLVRSMLVYETLDGETYAFWQRYAQQQQVVLPMAQHYRAYFVAADEVGKPSSLPLAYQTLEEGIHRVPHPELGMSTLKISSKKEGTLYLLMRDARLRAVLLRMVVVPIFILMLFLMLIAIINYRANRRAISPMVWLSQVVRGWHPDRPDVHLIKPDRLPKDLGKEGVVLAETLRGFATQNRAYLQREKQFTRDVSHELRTPLTVINMSADMLGMQGDMDGFGKSIVRKIRHASEDIEFAIESLLILSRDPNEALDNEACAMPDIVNDQCAKLQGLLLGKNVQFNVDVLDHFEVQAPKSVVSVLVTQLLRNACHYTSEGQIDVVLQEHQLIIEDTGMGMDIGNLSDYFDPDLRGHQAGPSSKHSSPGLGLTIVHRLCQRYGWHIQIKSQTGIGTTVVVDFLPAPKIP